jgi:energy-coupling factor transporter ATP-binding protein EcfA2
MMPDILVMDEPTSDLDPGARRRLIDLLKTFTHTRLSQRNDLDMVLDLCERTIIMSGEGYWRTVSPWTFSVMNRSWSAAALKSRSGSRDVPSAERVKRISPHRIRGCVQYPR